ncbi:kdo(2)-lipid A phosphoethanolamine 7''-transferase [Craterilacuibacter sp.]|uniref:kdo(2)-lipid A phosphoethanolamine 7''-transferase n=1 Tax=Craterilacuibacter sp. TaxID=2870909 RepID=UPI003F3E4B70
MRKLLSLSQFQLSLLFSVYIGVLLNADVLLRRMHLADAGEVARVGIELVSVLAFSYLLFALASMGGRTVYRVLASLLLLFSAAASYYMTVFNVVIGYGVVTSVLTTDTDLARESVGWDFVLWLGVTALPPLLLLWKSRLDRNLWQMLATRGQRLLPLWTTVLAVLLAVLPLRQLDAYQEAKAKAENTYSPSRAGAAAHSYLPSNWIAGLGMVAYSRASEAGNTGKLLDPATAFEWNSSPTLDDTTLVFVIGETSRASHFGVLGYGRDTSPRLAAEKNVLAFQGRSCDTATKLSLRCMFVREGGVADNAQRTLKERNVFAVLKGLGFSSELYAMQSELWFYNSLKADRYALREMVVSDKLSDGLRADDMLLLPQLERSLARHPKGKHLVVLHTKGSHYQYSQRYPREFARYTPECTSIDAECSKASLINAFDNSILYTDHVLAEVIARLKGRKALMVYVPDHGESIDENSHFHATPREIAPPEQFDVPVVMWASDAYLAQPEGARAFAALRKAQAAGRVLRQEEIFDSVLGCLGYSSPNGGIKQRNNWCAQPQPPAALLRS